MARRTWARVAGLLFVVSSCFPLVASLLSADQHPAWLGPLDVATAGALLLISLGPLRTSAEIQPEIVRASYVFYRGAAYAPLLLLVLFFLLADRVQWDVLLIGLAWRAWLLLYAFPFWLQAWREQPDATAHPAENQR